MRIAKEGYPLIFAGTALTIAAAAAGWKLIGGVLGLTTVAIAAFFRDPERRTPDGEGLIVSPADGKVVCIADINGESPVAGAATRVSIFLSPFDVHINRLPVTGKVAEIRYQPGQFFAAYKEEASEKNEQNALKIVGPEGRVFEVIQIAGVLARRIVCWAKAGDTLRRGERFGLIMFGSRTDLYLPAGCSIAISEGQRVKGGETILGRLV